MGPMKLVVDNARGVAYGPKDLEKHIHDTSLGPRKRLKNLRPVPPSEEGLIRLVALGAEESLALLKASYFSSSAGAAIHGDGQALVDALLCLAPRTAALMRRELSALKEFGPNQRIREAARMKMEEAHGP